MSLLDGVRYRLRALLRPSRYGRELDEELQHHLDLEASSARGDDGRPLTEREARLHARRDFGNVTYAREERRIVSGLSLLDSAGQDVRFVLRLLRRRAVFASVTIVTIALGIGAATSIYSVADAVLFRPLAFPGASRIMTVSLERPDWKKNPVQAPRWDRGGLSLPIFRDWRAAQTSFSAVAVYSFGSTMVLSGDSPKEVEVLHASASLLDVLGIRPERGASFTPDQDVVGGPPVALVSHEAWVAQLASDPNVLGRTVVLTSMGQPATRAGGRVDGGTAYTIIGVLPAGITIERAAGVADYWVPAGQDAQNADDRGNFDYRALGRLAKGGSLRAAREESARLLVAATAEPRVQGASVVSLRDDETRRVRAPLLLLLAASVVLLAIACINVATLLLGESASREREIRTRAALGAGRTRLLRQLMTENLVLAGAGAIAGIALALVGTRLIVHASPPNVPGIADVGINLRVLGVALVAACATGLAFSLVPALELTRLRRALTLGEHSADRGGAGRGRVQRMLIACEVALSMVLLVGGGLLVRSFEKLSRLDTGFRPADLAVARLRLPQPQYADSFRVRALYADLLDRLRLLPSVSAVAAATTVPFTGGSSSSSFQIEGRPEESVEAQRRVTTPAYFATMGIPVLDGRAYADADQEPEVVVSRSLARRDWPNESAVGKHVKIFGRSRTIVGVVGDVATGRGASEAPETLYLPLAQVMRGSFPALVVRARGDPLAAIADVRRVVRAVAPDVAVSRIDEMGSLMAESLAEDRLRATLISLFAAIAAVLAAVGTYGVAATAANRRMREMAIRSAVGASSGSIARLIIGSSARGVAAGALVGLVLAGFGARVIAPYLYGVATTDLASYASVIGLLAVTTLAATWVPAHRATRVPLVETLRAD